MSPKLCRDDDDDADDDDDVNVKVNDDDDDDDDDDGPSGHQFAELRVFAGLAVPSATASTGAAGTHLDGVGGALGDLHAMVELLLNSSSSSSSSSSSRGSSSSSSRR